MTETVVEQPRKTKARRDGTGSVRERWGKESTCGGGKGCVREEEGMQEREWGREHGKEERETRPTHFMPESRNS